MIKSRRTTATREKKYAKNDRKEKSKLATAKWMEAAESEALVVMRSSAAERNAIRGKGMTDNGMNMRAKRK